MLRKFFDPQEGEAKAESRVQFGEEISLTDVFESQSQQFLDKKEEEVAEEKVEEKKPEVIAEEKKEVVEEKKEAPIVEETKAPVIPDWKEFVKNPQYRKEVHDLLEIDEASLNLSKEIAQDEFVKKLVTYRKEHGNVTPFIEAATRDWDKVSPEHLILDDLKKQYSHLSSEKAEKLAKSDFNQRFIYRDDPNLTEEENREMAELTGLKLESESAKILNTRKAEQKNFLDSVTPIDKSIAQSKEAKEKMDADLKEFEEFKQGIEVSPVTSKLFAEKKIVFGEKENSFNYTVDPAIIKEQTLDTNKFYGNFWENGVFNQAKWNKVVAYTNYMTAVEEGLVNQGRSLGTKNVVEELENTKEQTDKSTKVVKKSLAKSFKEEGQEITLEQLYGG